MKDKIIKFIKDPEIWAYLIVGVLTTIVSMIVKLGLLYTILSSENALHVQLAEIISWIVAVAFAYITNRIFVFKSKSKKYFQEIVSFVGGRIFTLLVGMFIMWFICTLLGLNDKTWVLIATLIDQVAVTILNYVVSKIFVFKK
ncbi:MAG: GtrA family protein [Bacilli bacterium]|nr:GtrA family protein [Bacilli bacterium]